MGLFEQRVTGKPQTGLQNNYTRTGTASTSSQTSRTSLPPGYSHAQGMSFSKGQIIKGEVIDLRNNYVKIQLANSRMLSGTLDSTATLSIGDTATFQVSEATPSNVMLRVLANPQQLSQEWTIDKALEAANLPKTERNVNAVRELLNQGLSIDKNSIQNLLRQSATFRGVSFQALTLLMKHHIPLTDVNTAQMDRYLNYEHRIANQAQTLVTELIDSLTAATEQGNTAAMRALNQQLLQLLKLPDPLARTDTFQPNIDASLAAFDLLDADGTLTLLDSLEQFGISDAQAAGIVNGSASLSEVSQLLLQTADTAMLLSTEAAAPTMGNNAIAVLAALTNLSTPEATALFSAMLTMSPSAAAGTLANYTGMSVPDAAEMFSRLTTMTSAEAADILSTLTGQAASENPQEYIENLPDPVKLSELPISAAISQLPAILQTPEVYAILSQYAWLSTANLHLNSYLSRSERVELANHFRGRLPSTIIDKLENGELDTRELLRLLADLPERSSSDSSYTSSRAYQEMLQQALLSRFTLRPEHLTKGDALDLYYKALDFDLSLLEKSNIHTGTEHAFQDTAAAIRDNMDFIKTINQLYPYIQLPLKLTGQTAHAELYVYPRSRHGSSEEDGTRVLLHLDMEQLGPLDVHLNLLERELRATFYLSNSDSADITSENLPLLQRALENKGYSLQARVEQRSEQSDLLQDFMVGARSSGSMKRYSFDIRA